MAGCAQAAVGAQKTRFYSKEQKHRHWSKRALMFHSSAQPLCVYFFFLVTLAHLCNHSPLNAHQFAAAVAPLLQSGVSASEGAVVCVRSACCRAFNTIKPWTSFMITVGLLHDFMDIKQWEVDVCQCLLVVMWDNNFFQPPQRSVCRHAWAHCPHVYCMDSWMTRCVLSQLWHTLRGQFMLDLTASFLPGRL